MTRRMPAEIFTLSGAAFRLASPVGALRVLVIPFVVFCVLSLSITFSVHKQSKIKMRVITSVVCFLGGILLQYCFG